MNGVEYLIGSEQITNQPLLVYSDEAVDFLAELSAELLRVPGIRAWPDVVSVAFWCRRANVLKRRDAYGAPMHRLGRGLAFHIAPSNIPVNFVFTYFFALLAGNASIVRVPSRHFPQVDLICGAFSRVLPKHPEIARRTAFVRYPINDEITAAFCAMADVRVIWGGDRTVADVRRHSVKPRCVDIVFPDRYSICLIDGGVVLEADEAAIHRLAENFYNDTWLMDQNACSSPMLVLWQNSFEEAKTRFWSAALETAQKKYELQAAVAVDKYTHLCEDAVGYGKTVSRVLREGGNLLYRAQLSELPEENKTELRGKAGYFHEYDLASLDELSRIVNEKYQTVTYFGVDPEEVRALVLREQLPGIDRIVPIGSAMDIDIIWDGYDLVTMLSRVVDVRRA